MYLFHTYFIYIEVYNNNKMKYVIRGVKDEKEKFEIFEKKGDKRH